MLEKLIIIISDKPYIKPKLSAEVTLVVRIWQML